MPVLSEDGMLIEPHPREMLLDAVELLERKDDTATARAQALALAVIADTLLATLEEMRHANDY